MTHEPVSESVDATDDRDRILAAMVGLAGTRAWSSLSSDAVCAEAGVPRDAFDRWFKTVDACFVEAAEDALERLHGAVLDRADGTESSWPDRVCAIVAGFLGFLVSDRQRAWVAVVEPLGGRARVARKRTMRQLVELAGEAPTDTRGEDRAIAPTLEPQLAGLWERGRQYLADSEALPLEDVARSTIFLMLSPHLPREDAMRFAFTTSIEAVASCVPVAVGGGTGA